MANISDFDPDDCKFEPCEVSNFKSSLIIKNNYYLCKMKKLKKILKEIAYTILRIISPMICWLVFPERFNEIFDYGDEYL